MVEKTGVSRGHRIFLAVFMVIFFVPAGLGFATKLVEFVQTVMTRSDGRFEDGRFALIPLMNYLLVFAGMLCLLGWAVYNGMFRDVEGPKYTMLENERRLDEEEGVIWDNGNAGR